MNDIINNQSNEVASPLTPEQIALAAKERKVDMEKIRKQYYPSVKIVDAQVAMGLMSHLAKKYNLEVKFNFDIEADFPVGFGIGIIPIAKRVNNETVTLGIAIAQIPDIETVQKHEHGAAFILAAVSNNMMAKLANAVRPRGDNDETASSIPATVEDFITSNRPEGVLLGFNTYAGAYVKVLKKSGLKLLTVSILRQALQSKAFAEQQFPRVTQDKWTKILDSMVKRATDDGIAIGMLADWKQSRDSAELHDSDVDLADLDFDNLEAEQEQEQEQEQETAPQAATA